MIQINKTIAQTVRNESLIYVVYGVIVVAVSLIKVFLTEGSFNNYDIFRFAFFHLTEGQNLYEAHPEAHFDLYKYSPGFALFMAPFWFLNRTLGVISWNLLNALLPLVMLGRMKFDLPARWFFALFILFEMVTSVQNAQSNGLMLALMMWAFKALEQEKPKSFALAISLGVSIKLFAGVMVLMLFFHKQGFKWLIFSAVTGLVFLILPSFVTGIEPLWKLYVSWFDLLAGDAPHALNYSLMSFFERTAGFVLPNAIWLIAGMVLLVLPLYRRQQQQYYKWRLTYFALMLVWVVLFNHKTESPTFVIAMAGAALYYLSSSKTVEYKVLMVIVFIFTGLVATDIFPYAVRENFIKPYSIKVLPCIILFIYILKDLLFADYGKFSQPSESENNK